MTWINGDPWWPGGWKHTWKLGEVMAVAMWAARAEGLDAPTEVGAATTVNVVVHVKAARSRRRRVRRAAGAEVILKSVTCDEWGSRSLQKHMFVHIDKGSKPGMPLASFLEALSAANLPAKKIAKLAETVSAMKIL